LLNGAPHQRSPPDHSLVLLFEEQIDRHDADPRSTQSRKHRQWARPGLCSMGEVHLRDTWAGDIGVQDTDSMPGSAQRICQRADQRPAPAAPASARTWRMSAKPPARPAFIGCARLSAALISSARTRPVPSSNGRTTRRTSSATGP
jgi:hypothetical protein